MLQQVRKQIPLQRMEMDVLPNSSRKDESGHDLIDVVWSTGAPVVRHPWWDDSYIEELSMDADHVDLARLNNGAPCLNNHHNYDLRDMLGSIFRGSAKIEDGKGVATIRLSQREDVAGLNKDIVAGVISKISVGYRVNVFEEHLPTEEGKMRTLKAIDWTPMEVSFVCIPADDGSESRNEEEQSKEKTQEKFDVLIISQSRREKMDEVTITPEVRTETPVSTPEVKVNVEEVRKEATITERTRTSEIKDIVRAAKMEDSLSEKFIKDGTTADEARKEVFELMRKQDEETPTRSIGDVAITRDETDTKRESIESAIGHRVDSSVEIEKDAKRYLNMSMLEIARSMGGKETEGMDRRSLAGRALSHTSDLPAIFANVMGKTLRSSYDNYPSEFKKLARTTRHADFKGVKRVMLDDILGLEKLQEGGVIKHGALSDSAEEYKLASYAKQISITREMIINDDLDALARIPQFFGRNAAELEEDIFFDIFNANLAQDDAVALFHANHSNLLTGAAMAEASFDLAEEMMGSHKNGKGKNINISPKFLLVPRKLRTSARKLMGAVNPNSTSQINAYEGQYEIVSSNKLTSNQAWYQIADYNQFDTFEIAYLLGQEGVSIDREVDFDTKGIKISALHDFAAKAIDHRGVVKNPGV